MVYIVKLYESSDPTWDTFGVSIWSGIEVAVAIIAASIPATKPLVDTLFPALFVSSRGISQSASRRVHHSNSQERSSRRYQRKDVFPLSLVTPREESDTGDDESTKAIAHTNS
jgi:hypothetical protein